MVNDQIPADDILHVMTATDGAEIEAVLDRANRRYAVVCSEHGRIFSFYYTPASTGREHAWFREDTALSAAKHATSRHIKPRVDSAGGTSS